MNRLYVFVIIVLMLSGCTHEVGETVRICAYSSNESLFCGTAFTVDSPDDDRTLFMTSAHIFDPKNWSTAKSWIDHEEYGALDLTVEYIDFNLDIAVFSVHPFYEFETFDLCPGTPLFVKIVVHAEHPKSLTRSGVLTLPFYEEKNLPKSKFAMLSIKTKRGASGAPAVFNLDGCVVGMVYGGKYKYKVTLIVKEKDLKRALKRKTLK